MITHEKSIAQVRTPQVWDKATAAAQVGDEIRAPFMPLMQVVEKEVLADGRVRLLVKPVSASYSEEWIVEPQAPVEQQQPKSAPSVEQRQSTPAPSETIANQQPVELAGDSVAHPPQPDWSALAEYESGCTHGKYDAAARIPPMCQQASCPYTRGYLDGYSSILSSKKPSQPSKSIEWKVVHDPRWDLYQVWVGERCLMEKASSYEEGERIAQKYMAAEKLRRQHRELVMSAFAA